MWWTTLTKDVYIKLPALHPTQKTVSQHPARFKVLACGRRWGKSTLSVRLLAKYALQGKTVSYMALTYKNLVEVWRQLKRILKPAIIRISEQEKRLELPNGGVVELWSLEAPETIRSRAYHFIVIDEAAYIRNLLSVWNKVLTPMLADYEGSALLMSSPRGYNDFYTFSTYETKFPDWKTFRHPTWDNPHIPIAEIERVKAELPVEDFDQEYGAEFKSKSGLVYATWSEHNLTPDAVFNADLPIVWGVDDGYVHGDGIGTASYHPRVITFGQVHPDGSVVIFDEYVATLELPEKSIDNALALPYATPYIAYIDSSAQELKARLWSRGIQTVNATHRVQDGIDLVRRYICDGNNVRLLKVHPKCVNLIWDMEHYAYEKNQLGDTKPGKINENSADSLRYLLYSLRYDS